MDKLSDASLRRQSNQAIHAAYSKSQRFAAIIEENWGSPVLDVLVDLRKECVTRGATDLVKRLDVAINNMSMFGPPWSSIKKPTTEGE